MNQTPDPRSTTVPASIHTVPKVKKWQVVPYLSGGNIGQTVGHQREQGLILGRLGEQGVELADVSAKIQMAAIILLPLTLFLLHPTAAGHAHQVAQLLQVVQGGQRLIINQLG